MIIQRRVLPIVCDSSWIWKVAHDMSLLADPFNCCRVIFKKRSFTKNAANVQLSLLGRRAWWTALVKSKDHDRD